MVQNDFPLPFRIWRAPRAKFVVRSAGRHSRLSRATLGRAEGVADGIVDRSEDNPAIF